MTKTELINLGPMWKNKLVSREVLDSIATMEVSSMKIDDTKYYARAVYPGGYTGIVELASVWFCVESDAYRALEILKQFRGDNQMIDTKNPFKAYVVFRSGKIADTTFYYKSYNDQSNRNIKFRDVDGNEKIIPSSAIAMIEMIDNPMYKGE
jgi:hypothetical protein